MHMSRVFQADKADTAERCSLEDSADTAALGAPTELPSRTLATSESRCVDSGQGFVRRSSPSIEGHLIGADNLRLKYFRIFH